MAHLTPDDIKFITTYSWQSFGLIDYEGDTTGYVEQDPLDKRQYRIRFNYLFDWEPVFHRYHLEMSASFPNLDSGISYDELEEMLPKLQFKGQPVPMANIPYYSQEAAIMALQLAIRDTRPYISINQPSTKKLIQNSATKLELIEEDRIMDSPRLPATKTPAGATKTPEKYTISPQGIKFILDFYTKGFGIVDYQGDELDRYISQSTHAEYPVYEVKFRYEFTDSESRESFVVTFDDQVEYVEYPDARKFLKKKIFFSGDAIPMFMTYYLSKEAAIEALRAAIRDTKMYVSTGITTFIPRQKLISS
jgi:hypothetical protein